MVERPERDAFIAATALAHGMTVVTRKVADFAATGAATPESVGIGTAARLRHGDYNCPSDLHVTVEESCTDLPQSHKENRLPGFHTSLQLLDRRVEILDGASTTTHEVRVSDLRAHRFVVLLGEPGSGKSISTRPSRETP